MLLVFENLLSDLENSGMLGCERGEVECREGRGEEGVDRQATWCQILVEEQHQAGKRGTYRQGVVEGMGGIMLKQPEEIDGEAEGQGEKKRQTVRTPERICRVLATKTRVASVMMAKMIGKRSWVLVVRSAADLAMLPKSKNPLAPLP